MLRTDCEWNRLQYITEKICEGQSLYKAGFRRVVLVGGTNPEDTAGMIAAREVFR